MLNARDVCGVDRPRRLYYQINENSIARDTTDEDLLMFYTSEGLREIEKHNCLEVNSFPRNRRIKAIYYHQQEVLLRKYAQ